MKVSELMMLEFEGWVRYVSIEYKRGTRALEFFKDST